MCAVIAQIPVTPVFRTEVVGLAPSHTEPRQSRIGLFVIGQLSINTLVGREIKISSQVFFFNEDIVRIHRQIDRLRNMRRTTDLKIVC